MFISSPCPIECKPQSRVRQPLADDLCDWQHGIFSLNAFPRPLKLSTRNGKSSLQDVWKFVCSTDGKELQQNSEQKVWIFVINQEEIQENCERAMKNGKSSRKIRRGGQICHRVHLPLPYQPSSIHIPAQSSIYLPARRPSDPAMFSTCLSFACYDPTACLIGPLLPTLIPRWRKNCLISPARLDLTFYFYQCSPSNELSPLRVVHFRDV